MNIDNQLILGVVFITAGIAMALLAYAAFLNRRTPDSEEAVEAEVGEIPVALDADELAETTAADDVAEAPAAPVERPQAEFSDPAPATLQAKDMLPEPAAPETKMGAGSASAGLRRDPNSGRLVIDVGGRTYRSMEALQASDDWSAVNSLLSDLVAWLYKDSPPEKQKDERAAESEAETKRPPTMIEQINEVFKEKLAERPDLPQAVHMVEGVGGSIRVYIGVDGYPLDEVPNQEIRALIRQAVAEWESRT